MSFGKSGKEKSTFPIFLQWSVLKGTFYSLGRKIRHCSVMVFIMKYTLNVFEFRGVYCTTLEIQEKIVVVCLLYLFT